MSQQLRIVLMGKTGVGKSSFGNTLINWKGFKASSQGSSVTVLCKLRDGNVNKRNISVVDTPGYMDTETKNQSDIIKEIERSIDLSDPGAHVICYVVRIGRFTAENFKTFETLVKHFGEDFCKYVIVVFTGFDDHKRDCEEDGIKCDIQTYIKSLPKIFQKFIRNKCGSRVIGIDNHLTGVETTKQLDVLFKMIDEIQDKNGKSVYSIINLKRAKALNKAKQAQEKAILKRVLKEAHDKKDRVEFSYIGKDGNILRGRDGLQEKLITDSQKIIDKLEHAKLDKSGKNDDSRKTYDISTKQDQTDEDIRDKLVKNFRQGPLIWKPSSNSALTICGKIKGKSELISTDILYEQTAKGIEGNRKTLNLEAKGEAEVSTSMKSKGKLQTCKAKAEGNVCFTGTDVSADLEFRKQSDFMSSDGVKAEVGSLKAGAKVSIELNKNKNIEVSAEASLNVASLDCFQVDMRKTEHRNEPNISVKAGLVKGRVMNAKIVGERNGKKSNVISENYLAEANIGNVSMTGIDKRKSEVVNKQIRLNTAAKAHIGNIEITGISAKGQSYDVETAPSFGMCNFKAGINRKKGNTISKTTGYFNVDLSIGSPKRNIDLSGGKFNIGIPFLGGGNIGESDGGVVGLVGNNINTNENLTTGNDNIRTNEDKYTDRDPSGERNKNCQDIESSTCHKNAIFNGENNEFIGIPSFEVGGSGVSCGGSDKSSGGNGESGGGRDKIGGSSRKSGGGSDKIGRGSRASGASCNKSGGESPSGGGSAMSGGSSLESDGGSRNVGGNDKSGVGNRESLNSDKSGGGSRGSFNSDRSGGGSRESGDSDKSGGGSRETYCGSDKIDGRRSWNCGKIGSGRNVNVDYNSTNGIKSIKRGDAWSLNKRSPNNNNEGTGTGTDMFQDFHDERTENCQGIQSPICYKDKCFSGKILPNYCCNENVKSVKSGALSVSSSCNEDKMRHQSVTTQSSLNNNLTDPAVFNKCILKLVKQKMNPDCFKKTNHLKPTDETSDNTDAFWLDREKVEKYLFDEFAPSTGQHGPSSTGHNTDGSHKSRKKTKKSSSQKPFGSNKNIHTIFTLEESDTKEIIQKGSIACFKDVD